METQLKMTQDEFLQSIIAQHDDNDYSESGYVAIVFGDNRAALGGYSHCSCYDTYDSMLDSSRGMLGFIWTGTPDDLVAMARRCADPHMPERDADKEDYDYDHLQEVYKQVIEWDELGRKND